MKQPLPDFSNPPVVEVALAVHFDKLATLRTPQMVSLWHQHLRDRFPTIEEHSPIEPRIEKFGLPATKQVGMKLEMISKPPVPRCWFINESGSELIQVQQDWFAHNWRKAGSGDEYPRYDSVRTAFLNELKSFQEFISQEKLGDFHPIQCEVTYVNHIVANQEWNHHGQLSTILSLCESADDMKFLPEPEEVRMSGSFVIPSSDGEKLGRLRFSIEPAYRREDDSPVFLLNVVARGKPACEDLDGIMKFIDLGRKWIVHGFADITTSKMHEIWGRNQ